MMILASVLAVAFLVAIVVALVGRRQPAGPPRVTAEEVMKTDNLLRQLGGLDEEDRRRAERRQAFEARTGRAAGGGGAP